MIPIDISQMEQLSQRIKHLYPSATILMNQRCKDLQTQGIDIINLGVGEPDFNTPEHIKKAAKEAIDNNFSFYPPVAGYNDLRKAIVEKFKRENNLCYDLDQIVVSTGAKHSIANIILTLIDKGDEVIIPAPYWVTYIELVKLAEGKNIIVPTNINQNFKITPSQIERAITPRTKAILLCSPSNPTGSTYTKSELEAIARIVEKYPRTYVISDEIYEHINFVGGHQTIAQFDFIKDRVIVINGVSKGYAMTGWRIGYIAAPKWIAKGCIDLQGQFTSGATTIAQKAAIAALTGEQTCISQMNQAFLRRRDMIYKLINEIEGVKVLKPDGAFYLFPDISSFFGKSDGSTIIKNSYDLCQYLLNKAHISTVPGDAFGNSDCVRISYANSDEKLIEAMSRMKKALAILK